jgi:GT2 family glycosyltransferase
VDNGSNDGSLEYIERMFGSNPMVKIIKNKTNLGCATARNIGASFAQGEILCFLDSDTVVHPKWLAELIKALDNPIIGSAQPKLMVNDLIVDGFGDFIDILGDGFSFGSGGKDQHYQKIQEIFSSKGAALAVRREVFDAVNGFDENFFLYVEDNDFGWRIRLAGYVNVLAPTSIVYHVDGEGRKKGITNFIIYNDIKNRLMMIIKNHALNLLLLSLPMAIFSAFVKTLFLAFNNKNPKALSSCFKAVFQSLFNKQVWCERRKVQVMTNKILSTQIKNKMLFPPLIIIKIIWYIFYRDIPLPIFLNNIYKKRIFELQKHQLH